METLLNEIETLTVKRNVYASMWGNNADEVIALDSKIREINMIILDLMVPEQDA